MVFFLQQRAPYGAHEWRGRALSSSEQAAKAAGGTRGVCLSAEGARDYRGSDGFCTMARSDGFCTMEIGFSVMDSALRIGRNRHWSFILLPGRPRDSLGRFLGSDVLPLVCRPGIADLTIRQSEQVRAPPYGIARASMFGKLNEPERAHFT